MIRDIADTVAERGWWIGTFSGTLLALASQFGRPVPARNDGPVIDRLRVQHAEDAHLNSLSARHGTGSFPLHSDGAHHVVVPKYVVLRLASQTPSERGTILADFRRALAPEEERCLKEELWIVRTGRRAFLAPVIDGHFLRYDPGVMTHATPTAARTPSIVRNACDRARTDVVRWAFHLTVVLDNHRVLHGREASSAGEVPRQPRVLERVLVRTDELEH